jgi:quercetin dioxygenase-like cupin family protein
MRNARWTTGVALTTLALLVPTAAWAEAGSTGVTRSAPAATATSLPAAGSVVRAKGITRTVLSVSEPANAPGQVLYLTRVRIAPKARLSEHFHDGTQIATVESGVLTYRITSGSVTITRADGTARTVTGPRTVRIRAGQSLVEGAGLTHYGANATTKPVVILTAALIATGAGLSTPIGTAATASTGLFGPDGLAVDLTVPTRNVATVGPAKDRTAGSLIETGTGTVGDDRASTGPYQVRLDATVLFSYVGGSGPFTGVFTYTWPADGSTLVAMASGATVATADGGATFAATLGVVGGTGRFAPVTGGTGTYTGSRAGAVGSPIATRTRLSVSGL